MTSKYTLGSVKIMRAFSEETTAFTGVLLKDGVPFAEIANRGTGGCNDCLAFTGKQAELQAFWEYAKTLPAAECYGVKLDMNGDLLISLMLDKYEVEQEAKKLRKNHILSYRNGQLRKSKKLPAAQIAAYVYKPGDRAPTDQELLNVLAGPDGLYPHI